MAAQHARPLPYPSRFRLHERDVAVGIVTTVLLILAMVAWGAITLFG